MHIKSSDKRSMSNDLYEMFYTLLDSEFEEENSDYRQYQNDPVRFGEDVLGETYTADIKRLMESVRDNPVTVAMSANATGKTHGAARIAVWFYKCHSKSQVYSAAAPPESNLKKLLWGEIGGILEKHPDLFKKRHSNKPPCRTGSSELFNWGHHSDKWNRGTARS